jgi:RecA-family ATPase
MPFTGGEIHKPAKVLFLSVEDSPEYVLRPRFERMGGDLERLAVLRGSFEFDAKGFADLEATIKGENIKFVLIDPLFSFTGRADINNTADVRPITDRLNTLASTHGIALLGIRHLNKSKGYGDPANAGAHARAWRQGCRSNLFIGHDAGDKSRRGIAQTKLNVGAESKEVYGFEIDPEGVFRWTGESDLTVEEMTAQVTNENNEERSAKADAMAFLRETLSDGPKDHSFILEEARGCGISERTLNRAKKALNVKPKKKSFGQGWIWYITEDSGLEP